MAPCSTSASLGVPAAANVGARRRSARPDVAHASLPHSSVSLNAPRRRGDGGAASRRATSELAVPSRSGEGERRLRGDPMLARAVPAGAEVNGAGARGYGGDDWWQPAAEAPPFRVEAPKQRIVAIGDLHGDFAVTTEALRLGGVIGGEGVSAMGAHAGNGAYGNGSAHGRGEDDIRWTGGNTIVVQVGDILDRGDEEIAILSLLRHLDTQAREQGGRVFQINGNHETINVSGEYRYVTNGGYHECEHFAQYCMEEWAGDWAAALRNWWRVFPEFKGRGSSEGPWTAWNPLQQMGRLKAVRTKLFQPGGPIARELSRHGVALMVNDTLFAHGGVLPHHIDHGLPRMNEEVSRWMRGARTPFGDPQPVPFIATRGFDSIVWSRLYSQEFYPSADEAFMACAVLASTLDAVGAARLVVGHTPQITGANSACNGRVWRIDVGMSSGMLSAPPQVLEIDEDGVRVLRGERQPNFYPDAAFI